MFSIGTATMSFAQNVWTGTSTPTTTMGKVGIGTTNPGSSLMISTNNAYLPIGTFASESLTIHDWVSRGTSGSVMSIYRMSSAYPTPPPALLFAVNGEFTTIPTKLRIGTKEASGAYAGYKLSVDGDMIAKRCVIQVNNWADYVFDEHYALPSLADVEKYVNENKHLPGVPSEAEIKKEGVEVGEMNKILMQKVEELTLYIIDQQKQLDALKAAHK